MKKILLVLAIASLFVVGKKVTSFARNEVFKYTFFKDGEPILLKKVSVNSNVQKIVGESTSADFKIVGDAASNAYVEVFAKSGNNKKLSLEEAQKFIADKYILDIQQSGNELKLIAKRKSGFNWNNSDNINIRFNIHVPSNVSTKITSTSGDVSLQGLNGDQLFSATSGDFAAENIKGNIQVKTTSGDASLINVSGGSLNFDGTSGDLSLETGTFTNIKSTTTSGDISLHNASGNLIASSSSGDLNIVLNRGSVQAGSSSGDQNLEIKNPKDFIRTSAGSGDIRIKVPSNIGADVNLRGSSVSMSSKSKFVGDFTKDRSAVGKWNGGGLIIDVKTGSGDINLDWN
jgi:DUF4097 and DUF4098 domain-containing protein YvlB